MGTCEVCWSREAEFRCAVCGRAVCAAHYVAERGMCSVCYENLCSVCGERLAVDSCAVCGRLICRRCSVELQPGIRVCSECATGLRERLKSDSRLRYLERLLGRGQQP